MQRATPHYLHRLPNLPLVDATWPSKVCPDQSSVYIPSRMVRRNTYALEVRGDSMIDCNIHDGDVIIIERYESAENGETAVVMINNQEVTLKKLYIEKSGARLQPANQDMLPIYLKNDDIQVLAGAGSGDGRDAPARPRGLRSYPIPRQAHAWLASRVLE